MSAKERIIPVFIPHRGCPHACVFCDQRRISGADAGATVKTVEDAIEQAAALPRDGAKRQLAFYGGSFTAIPAAEQEAFLALALAAKREGKLDSLRLSTRPDAVDDTVIRRLKRYEVETVELGAQSMDEEVLRLSGRGHSAEQLRAAARALKAAGFRLILQMMTGLPGDTEEKSLDTARELIALAPDGVRIYPTAILRGTPLEALWRSGRYREHSVEEAVELCAKLLPLFEQAGIPVIRLGLNPSEALGHGGVVGGAYHPALGELVRSRVLYHKARDLLDGMDLAGAALCLGVEPRLMSQLAGQKRQNIRRLREDFGLRELRLRPMRLKNQDLCVISVEKTGQV